MEIYTAMFVGVKKGDSKHFGTSFGAICSFLF